MAVTVDLEKALFAEAPAHGTIYDGMLEEVGFDNDDENVFLILGSVVAMIEDLPARRKCRARLHELLDSVINFNVHENGNGIDD